MAGEWCWRGCRDGDTQGSSVTLIWAVGKSLVSVILALSSINREELSHSIDVSGMIDTKPSDTSRLSLMVGFQVGGEQVLEQEPQEQAL